MPRSILGWQSDAAAAAIDGLAEGPPLTATELYLSPLTPTAPAMAASKAYVDSAIGVATNLQNAYDNSVANPEIATTDAGGAVTLRRGTSGGDADAVLEIQNAAGAATTRIGGDGLIRTNFIGGPSPSVGVAIESVLVKQGAINTAAGSLGAVAYGFVGDIGTGLYRPAAATLALNAGGVASATLTSSTATFNATIAPVVGINGAGDFRTSARLLAGLGTAGAPSIAFGPDDDTGLYRGVGNDSVCVSAGGACYLEVEPNTVKVAAGATLSTNVIAEATNNSGVTIDGVLVKDGLVDGVDVSAIATTYLPLAGGTISGPIFAATAVNIGTSFNPFGQLSVTTLQTASGTAGIPSMSFLGDTATGLWRPGPSQLGFSTGGTNRLTIDAGGAVTIGGAVTVGSLATAGLVDGVDVSTLPGLITTAQSTANAALPRAGGTMSGSILTSAANDLGSFASPWGVVYSNVFQGLLQFQAGTGAAVSPTYSFLGDLNTGLWHPAADQVGISTGGVNRVTVSTGALTVVPPLLVNAGSAAAPSLSFSGDSNSGLYSADADQVGISTGGVNRVTVNNGGVNISGNINLFGGDITGLSDIALTGGSSYISSPGIAYLRGGTDTTPHTLSVGPLGVYPDSNNVTQCGLGGGLRGWSVVNSYAYVTVSDSRLKNSVAPLPAGLGLAFVESLTPRTYKMNPTVNEGLPDIVHTRTHLGFIAQEVEAAIVAAGETTASCDIVDNDALADPEAGADVYLMRHDRLIPCLVKAIQELSAANAALAARVAALEAPP